jgi:multidrug efflux system outer membrane protein
MKKIRKRCYLPGLLIFIALLLGCSSLPMVGPDYVPPQANVPQGWQQPPDPALVPGRAEIKNWWAVFNDPVLTRLIEQISEGNLDVRIAIARVNEARARLGIATGQQVPVVDAGGAVAGERVGGVNQTRYSVGLDASWEIDLFGKIGRSVEATAAEFQATEEDRIDVMITMYAEMARTYLLIRTLQTRLKAASGNIESQREILALTQSRLKHGLSTALDVAQAEQVLASSEAAVPPLRIELARSINTIALLLGKPPGTFYEELGAEKPVPVPPLQVSVGVPADLLRQRPDIRRAERQLAAQTARIGVATADLYPSFSLTGSLGVGSLNTGDLFDPASRSFSIIPSFRWNVFDAGRTRNQIKVEDARTEQALIVYERTVLDALNEVENAMTSFIEQRIQFEAQLRSVQAARRSLELSTRLYKEGLSGFQNVLDSQRAVFDYENQVAEAQGKASINLVRLYKALGGGWDPSEIDNRQTPDTTNAGSAR